MYDVTADTEWVEITPEDGKRKETAQALLKTAGDQPEFVLTTSDGTFRVPAELAEDAESALAKVGADIGDGQDGAVDDKPAGNASTDVWHGYALAHGKTEQDLDGLGRDEIRALFTD